MEGMSWSLETPRLTLRPFEQDDVDALASILGDAETMIHFPKPLDRAAVEGWIERHRRGHDTHGHGYWAAVSKETGQLIGDCGLARIEVEGEPVVDLGYHFHRRFWGQGLAAEAAHASLTYGFGRLGLSRVIALVRPVNVRSRRLAERMGMRIEREVEYKAIHHYLFVADRPPPELNKGI
jgi:[ribosomal protein S5]-alanine N-acetyltransferase